MRRHHLIEEAKAELDVAYEAVKRAESQIMALEQQYNERIKSLKPSDGADGQPDLKALTEEKESIQAGLDLGTLYKLQSGAVERFSLVSSAFTIVGSVEDDGVSVDLIKKILFRDDEVRGHKIGIDGALREFTRGLRAYSRKESSPGNDARVRRSWASIEELLRGFGRNI